VYALWLVTLGIAEGNGPDIRNCMLDLTFPSIDEPVPKPSLASPIGIAVAAVARPGRGRHKP
jgi:hypothetical protein